MELRTLLDQIAEEFGRERREAAELYRASLLRAADGEAPGDLTAFVSAAKVLGWTQTDVCRHVSCIANHPDYAENKRLVEDLPACQKRYDVAERAFNGAQARNQRPDQFPNAEFELAQAGKVAKEIRHELERIGAANRKTGPVDEILREVDHVHA